MKIGQNLKRIRELQNLKREYIAELLGVSVKTYSRLETDEVSPTLERLSEIADCLSVSVSEILDFDSKTVFNNVTHNQQGEYVAYNATEIKQVQDLYKRLLSEKEAVISALQSKK